MKTEYMRVFAPRVAAKMKNAEAMGSKTTWTTRDHLDALACVVIDNLGITGGPEQVAHWKGQVSDVLTECYNVSSFQQTLAKAYKATGHFQREGTKGLSVHIAELQAAVGAASQEGTA